MVERDRQVVIFGNFNTITFNDVLKFGNVLQKYSLQINAQPDLVDVSQNNNKYFSQNQMIRPVLVSKDNKTIVFLGSSRIHVEQRSADIESFDYFKTMALDIIAQILSLFKVSVNRVALNGCFFCDNFEKINTQFELVFKNSNIYNNSSKEWQFRINTVDKDNSIGSEINKIISVGCTPLVASDGQPKVVLEKNYDYNTRVENNKIYNLEEIKQFIISATNYREKVLKELD